MTALARRRTEPAPTVDLAAEGIHRDPTNHDPQATGSFTQRLVNRASGLFAGRTSRRSFLTRTAVVGSALAVGPLDFIMKPGTAYGYVCGTCTDGWTAFCCTINNGSNSCPPGSFVAGWWKADNAAYCCGAARYIIDCNATCPTQCSCRCSGASCDGRKTCCNQFRYGQCHTEIACYGPVVCRVATCTPPWQYDPSCTTSSATDNRTVNHGAPCLADCGDNSPIGIKYQQLGGAAGILGPLRRAETGFSDRRGRVARYQNGNIYWTSTTGAHEVHGALLTEYSVQGGAPGRLGYPTSDGRRDNLNRSTYNDFERGRIYYRGSTGTFTVPSPFFARHESMGGVYGVLGYPKANVRGSSDGRSQYQNYDTGRLYLRDGKLTSIHGATYPAHEAASGVHGPLGYPVNEQASAGDGRGQAQWFENGLIFSTPTTGAHGLWGKTLWRYSSNGHVRSYIGYPTSRPLPVGDGRGTVATFERGNIYSSTTTDAFQVHGHVLAAYLDVHGGPTGAVGYPLGELDPAGTPGGRFQQFEGGRLQFRNDYSVVFHPN